MTRRNIAEHVLFDETSPHNVRTEFLHAVWRDERGQEGDAFMIRTTKPGRPFPFVQAVGQHLIGPLRKALEQFEESVRDRHSMGPANLRDAPRPPSRL